MRGLDIQFDVFSKDFFNISNTWAIDKKSRGIRVSERHCKERTDLLNNHVLPFFNNTYISQIDRGMIKDFRNQLYQNGYSGSTINKTLSVIKAILEDAEDRGIIKAIPRIDRAALNPKEKGILTIDEVKKLFSIEWYTKESFKHPAKINYIGKTINRLAASTGLRLGEIQGLTMSDIFLDEGYIIVRRSWDNRLKLLNQTTKTGRERTIFIPEKVIDDLEIIIENNPIKKPDSFIFYSESKPTQPIAQRVFTDSLYKAMQDIGINEAERKERNITFHSWRHFLNSLLINSKIPLQKIQQITGHLTQEMTRHYYHLDDMQDVKEIQESLFLNS